MSKKNYILSKEVIEKKLRRMALEVVERNYDESQLVLIGIKDNGVVIAKKIGAYMKGIFNGEVTIIELIIDKKKPGFVSFLPVIDFNEKVVVIIDDVANSGRTMLYALKPLLETHPKKIQTMALVERTHKSFPIDVDYVGMSVSTTYKEHIVVEVDGDEVEGAWMEDAT